MSTEELEAVVPAQEEQPEMEAPVQTEAPDTQASPTDPEAPEADALPTECLAEPEAVPEPEIVTEPMPEPAQTPEKPKKKRRKKPPLAVRALLKLLCVPVGMVLFVTVIVAVLLLDLRHVTTSGGIKQLVNATVSAFFEAPAPTVPTPQRPIPQVHPASDLTVDGGTQESATITTQEDGTVVIEYADGTVVTKYPDGTSKVTLGENATGELEGGDGTVWIPMYGENGRVELPEGAVVTEDGTVLLPDGSVWDPFGAGSVEENTTGILGDVLGSLGDIPDDILAGGSSSTGALVDWIYEQVEKEVEGELPFSREEVRDFVAESTASDYLAEKLAGFAEDMIYGTENTQITADELMTLLDENQQLMKERLNVEITPELREQIGVKLEEVVTEELSENIRDTVYNAVGEIVGGDADSMSETVAKVQEYLQMLASPQLLAAAIGVPVVLILLLCLLNFYNFPAGLTWAGVTCISAGVSVSLPIFLMQNSGILGSLIPQLQPLGSLLSSYAGVFAPFHYGLLAIGLVLTVGSIVWRILRRVR